MSMNQDMLQLGKRIAAAHDWSAAKAFKSYVMTDEDRASISRCGIDLLAIYPKDAGHSATISAALSVSLERAMPAPVHVMRGRLWADGFPAEPTWHWLMAGPCIIDIALFRHAYSATAPAPLAKHIDLMFGANKALYVDHWSLTKRVGLRYQPEAVLTKDEINTLMGEAFLHIKQALTPSLSV